jgi:sarcosine oxidase
VSFTSSEVCVIGGGVIGLAAAAKLRDRGVDVACLERSQPGQGQSAGRTRQFRHLHAEPHLIELAVRAREGWLEWEQQFGRSLLGREGALRAGAGPAELEALRAAGIAGQELDLETAHQRFPIAALPPGRLLWDPGAGAIRADATVQALAARLGRAIQHTAVEAIAVRSDAEVELRTSSPAGVHRCAHAVVCAGAGTDRLVRPLGIEIHQDRQAHLRLSFRIRSIPPHPLPCFSDRTEAAGEVIYALSDLDDRYAVGLAAVTTYPPVADLATDLPQDIDLTAQRERIIAYVRRVLPGLDPQPVDRVLRLTTTLPEYPEDGFGIWRHGPVTALAGPNLFKFAPVIGEQLARIATQPPASQPPATRPPPATQPPAARPPPATERPVSTAPGTPAAPSR